MIADNEYFRAIEDKAWTAEPGIDLLFETPDPEKAINESYFVVTYNFQPVAAKNPQYRGIRELESPLSDY
jgi:hypothetical protein